MTKTRTLTAEDKHLLARDRVAQGLWIVDPEAGLVRNSSGRRLGYLDHQGYVMLGLNDGGRKRHVFAHRVIWESVHGPLPVDYGTHQINHINSDRADNRLVNLEVVTAQQNTQHCHRAGRAVDNNGDAAPWSKLTAMQVAEIRRRFASGEAQKVLAAAYGVSRGYVSLVVCGRRWSSTMDEQ